MLYRLQFSQPEKVIRHLVSLLEEPADHAWLSSQQIIVPSMDFARWLQTEVARQSAEKIAANIDYFQPAEFVDHWSSELTGEDDQPEWTKMNMHWALFQLLPELHRGETTIEGLPMVGRQPGRQQLRWYRLAGHLADTYDKYMIYRPAWLVRWRYGRFNSGSDQLPDEFSWQGQLWHRLCDAYFGFTDRALRGVEAQKYMNNQSGIDALPEKVFLVQVPTLPQAAVRWFTALGSVENLDLHVLEWQPLSETLARQPAKTLESGTEPDSDRFRRLTRQWNEQRSELFRITGGWDKLNKKDLREKQKEEKSASLTNNLTLLQQRLTQQGDTSARDFDPAEDPPSIQIHAAHGPLREVEVLYEKLLECFDRNEHLSPDDILIVSPDMETYAPHINTVFDEPGDEEKRIPFHRFDTEMEGRYQLAELLVDLLKLARGRFKVTEMLEILAHPAIRSSVNLDLQDVDQIEKWLLELNVRWGYNAEHRREILQPRVDESGSSTESISEQNSWQQALDRLWLGLSTRTKPHRLLNERLPYRGVEGTDDGHRLGALQRIVRRLWQLHRFLEEPHSLPAWKQKLTSLVREWLTVERDQEPDRQWLMEQVTAIDDFVQDCETDDSLVVTIDIILEMLEEHILQQRLPVSRMAGRAVVAPMVPVRGIPFKLIAMVGLNQDNFPGSDPTNPFDVTQVQYRPGDRSRRTEDRQLMLDYLLAARERLLITYTGKDLRNDEQQPPSPMVVELLDVLEDGGDPIESNDWITHHPLHGFEARDTRGDTYLDSRYRQSLQAFKQERQNPEKLTALAGLDTEINWSFWAPEQKPVSFTVQDIQGFYRHPVKYFCEQRLGIRLREEEQVDTDEEPFRLEGLSKYKLYDEILVGMLQDQDWTPDIRTYREKGILPHGSIGQAAWSEARRELDEQRDIILDDLDFQSLEDPVELEMTLNLDDHPIELHGESGLLAGDLQVIIKTGGRLKPKDRLAAWIAHLFCNASGHEMITCLWGRDSGNNKQFKVQEQFDKLSVNTSKKYLHTLLRGQLIGGTAPLALLPRSSYAWADAYFSADSTDQEKPKKYARNEAAESYHDEYEYYAYKNESNDPYYRYFFHDINPWQPGKTVVNSDTNREIDLLIDTARRIWKPVWEVRL